MTPEERCDAIAKEMYMGEVPDLWNLMARQLIVLHIKQAEEEAVKRASLRSSQADLS